MKTNVTSRSHKWKCHLPNLLKEVLNNPGTGGMLIPINITKQILCEVAERAIKINDPILNELMCDLALYETPLPGAEGHKKFIKKIRLDADKQRKSELKINNPITAQTK